jgi:predicted nucleic acid-binding protein
MTSSTPPSPHRFCLDTNVFDLIVAEGLVDAVNRLQDGGVCELLVCYAQEQEIARMKDPAKRAEAQRIRTRHAEPGAAMWASWECLWGIDSSHGVTVDTMRGNTQPNRHANDTQIAATAARHRATFVTCEQGSLVNRFLRAGTDVEAWSGAAFVQWVRDRIADLRTMGG